jgi:proteasome lid subunit RPN8/RPN11
MTANFGRWTNADGSAPVEYSAGVMEDVRAYVADGFRRVAHGGVEVGGVLFGTRAERGIRILAMRPVACSYTRGPVFILTPTDQVALRRTVALPASDPALTGMTALGWFLSHTRSGLALSDDDRDIFETYFPRVWQVTLMLRPGRKNAARGVFFVRGADGSIAAGPQPEFEVEANPDAASAPQPAVASLAAAASPVRRPGNEVSSTAAPQVRRLGAGTRTLAGDARSNALRRIDPQSQAVVRFEPPRFLTEQPVPKSRNWRWFFVCALALACGALALRTYLVSSNAPGLSLEMAERNGEMRIEWNRAAPAIRRARQGELHIADGAKTRTVELGPGELSIGAFPFVRHAADVTAQLTVFDASGAATRAVARYIGQPVITPPSADLVAAREELERLRSENQRLNDQLKTERGRADELQGRLDSLQNVLRIERNRIQVLEHGKNLP